MNTDKHRSGFTPEAQRSQRKRLEVLGLKCKSVFFCVLCASGVNLFAASPEPKFEPQTIDGAITIGYGVAVGEVDGDGKPDILLADAKQIVWYKNPGKAGEAWKKYVMAENLTPMDNVCIAARDINGDGKVEVAVGAQWNPGETTDPEKSGAIFYLIRPADPTQKWEPVKITPHDPTVHRMRWVQVAKDKYQLLVLPLHGRGNIKGEGLGVRMIGYEMPADPKSKWNPAVIETSMHMTHNFGLLHHQGRDGETVIVGGREGTRLFTAIGGQGYLRGVEGGQPGENGGVGEVRYGNTGNHPFVPTIEPMHGNVVVVAIANDRGQTPQWIRHTLDDTLKEGHALWSDDFLGVHGDQVIAGWRQPNAEKKVGIRMYVPQDEKFETWKTYTIDDNKMACEDLKVADLDGDGRLDIVASGRATKNVIVYWNRTEATK